MSREAAQRSKLGRTAGAGFEALERSLLRRADGVVPITPDFDEVLDQWSVDPSRRTVIENWAPLAEVPVLPRENDWSRARGVADRLTYVYAGTLGLKHNPDVLFDLARDQPEADVVVVSEGMGADRLRERTAEVPTPNLHLLPFQPWEDLPQVLATADVLVVLLEEQAGTFSVPSKILTSLCAGRSILAAVPASNLGARTILGAGAGVVVPPGDPAAFLAAARELAADPARRDALGAAGRAHAEAHFDIEAITDRFLEVLTAATSRQHR